MTNRESSCNFVADRTGEDFQGSQQVSRPSRIGHYSFGQARNRAYSVRLVEIGVCSGPRSEVSFDRKSVGVYANRGSAGAVLFIAVEKQIREGALISRCLPHSFVRSCSQELNGRLAVRAPSTVLLTCNVSSCRRPVIEF